MNRMLAKISVVVLIALGAIGGCGGGGSGDACDFVISVFFNGASADQATSQWDCVGSKPGAIVPDFAFQAFDDRTGFSSGIGPFTFEETGCRRISFQSGAGDGNVINIEGSIASGILTFDQTSSVPELNNISAGCLLQVF